VQKLKKTNIFYELLAALKTLFNGADNIVLLRDFEEKFVKKLIVFLKAESAKNQNINEYMVCFIRKLSLNIFLRFITV